MSVIDNTAKPTFSIASVTAAVHGNAQGTSDVPISFGQVTRGVAANITVNAS